MAKWGIPPSTQDNQEEDSADLILLERLVWVQYQSYWWPALLYHSYTELQEHLYPQLDMILKAQFAMAILRSQQENRQVKVARLLGRSILEVIELSGDDDASDIQEFYWALPRILPTAIQMETYSKEPELFTDFHRALDQVEDIIRNVSEENFALLPKMEHASWLERAEDMLGNHNHRKSSPHRAVDSSSVRHRQRSPSRPLRAKDGKFTIDDLRRRQRGRSRGSKGHHHDEDANEVVQKAVSFTEQREDQQHDEVRAQPVEDDDERPTSDIKQQQRDPINVLPGLEGDDIVPGLSSRVENARDVWHGVLQTLLLAKDDEVTLPDRKPHMKTLPPSTKKDGVEDRSVMTPPSVQRQQQQQQNHEDSEMISVDEPKPRPKLSFWQRITCASNE